LSSRSLPVYHHGDSRARLMLVTGRGNHIHCYRVSLNIYCSLRISRGCKIYTPFSKVFVSQHAHANHISTLIKSTQQKRLVRKHCEAHGHLYVVSLAYTSASFQSNETTTASLAFTLTAPSITFSSISFPTNLPSGATERPLKVSPSLASMPGAVRRRTVAFVFLPASWSGSSKSTLSL
jgi:acid stress-induced BolA-like protein IbaG/YrbA